MYDLLIVGGMFCASAILAVLAINMRGAEEGAGTEEEEKSVSLGAGVLQYVFLMASLLFLYLALGSLNFLAADSGTVVLNSTSETSFYWNCSQNGSAPQPPEKDCTNISWWLELEEGSGDYGTFLYDACPELNNFTRAGWTEQEPAVWNFGQHFGFVDDWAILQNVSALTTGSRTWRTIINFSWRYGTGFYSDNETLYGQDWANFMMWEGDESFYCYCRQADTSLRWVSAPVPTGQWVDIICSYDADDSGRLTMYLNGTSIVSNTGPLCDYAYQQGEAVIDSYPVVGVLPRLDAIYDETLYRRQATTPLEAYCLYTTNTFDCSGEPEPGNETITYNGSCDSVNTTYNYTKVYDYSSTADWLSGPLMIAQYLIILAMLYFLLRVLLVLIAYVVLVVDDWAKGKGLRLW